MKHDEKEDARFIAKLNGMAIPAALSTKELELAGKTIIIKHNVVNSKVGSFDVEWKRGSSLGSYKYGIGQSVTPKDAWKKLKDDFKRSISWIY